MSHTEQRKLKMAELAKKVLPEFTIKDLISCGAHYGHRASSWNADMKPYIFGIRNKTHIMDLRVTHASLVTSLLYLYNSIRSGKSVLMVSTKRSVSGIVKKHAVRCGQAHVTHRWLGGMLTNWRTVVLSIKKIKNIEKILSQVDEKGRHNTYTKKELGVFRKDLDKLKLYFDGLRGITARPDIVIVFDTNKDSCSVEEAYKLGLSCIGIVDTNSIIKHLSHTIPCNDDSMKTIEFIAKLISDTILRAIKDEVESYKISTDIVDQTKKNQVDDVSKRIQESVKRSTAKAKTDDKKSENDGDVAKSTEVKDEEKREIAITSDVLGNTEVAVASE